MAVDPVAARDAIDTAIARGEQTVSFGDRTVTYRSIDDLLKARAAFDAQIAAQIETTRPRRWLLYGNKGT